MRGSLLLASGMCDGRCSDSSPAHSFRPRHAPPRGWGSFLYPILTPFGAVTAVTGKGALEHRRARLHRLLAAFQAVQPPRGLRTFDNGASYTAITPSTETTGNVVARLKLTDSLSVNDNVSLSSSSLLATGYEDRVRANATLLNYAFNTTFSLFGGFSYDSVLALGDIVFASGPFNNHECLHCHLGARTFEEEPGHHKTPDMMAKIKSNPMSCMTSNCHDTIHDLDDLKYATFWKENQ